MREREREAKTRTLKILKEKGTTEPRPDGGFVSGFLLIYFCAQTQEKQGVQSLRQTRLFWFKAREQWWFWGGEKGKRLFFFFSRAPLFAERKAQRV